MAVSSRVVRACGGFAMNLQAYDRRTAMTVSFCANSGLLCWAGPDEPSDDAFGAFGICDQDGAIRSIQICIGRSLG